MVCARSASASAPSPTIASQASGAVRSTAVTPGFRERFGLAYDLELQRWVDAARRGTVDVPGAWDGYGAQAVCAAGVAALHTGRRTEVRLESRGGTPS